VRNVAPQCERRCPGAPDEEEERTDDRSEYEAFIDRLVPGVQNKGKIFIKSIPIG